MEPRNARTVHQREEGQALYLLAPSIFLSLMAQNLPHRIFWDHTSKLQYMAPPVTQEGSLNLHRPSSLLDGLVMSETKESVRTQRT